jgi:hypothetical protein
MSVPLGRDARTYYNTGSFASPAWGVIKRIRDQTTGGGATTIDVATRETAFKASAVVEIDRTVSFQIIKIVTDASYLALESAYFNKTPLDVLALNGPVMTSGSRGTRAICAVTKFEESYPLGEKQTVDVELTPTLSDDLPQPVLFTV